MNALNLREARQKTPPLEAHEIQECTARLQAAVFDAVSEVDMAEIVKAQVKKAKEGNSAAARTVFALVAAAARITEQEADRRKLLPKPIEAMPGSPAKLEEMERRRLNGQALCVPGDGRNGHD